MSLDKLTAILPPPKKPADAVSAEGWALAELVLGTALPADYRAFVETFGAHRIAGALQVLTPFASDPGAQLGRQNLARIAELAAARKGVGVTAPFGDEGARWLLWGRADNGAALYWRASGAPDAWTVAVGRADEGPAAWQGFDVSMTAFLAGWIAGEIACDRLPARGPALVAASRAAGDAAAAKALLGRAIDAMEAESGARLRADVPVGWGGPIGALEASADGRVLAVGHGASVSVLDAATFVEVARLEGHTDTVSCASIEGDAIATGSVDGSARVWSASSGAPKGDAIALGARVEAVQLGRGDQLLATFAGGQVQVHGAAAKRFAARGGDAAAFGAGGARLAASDGSRVEVFDVDQGKSVRAIPRGRAAAVAFSPSGAEVAVGDADGFVTTWNAAGGAAGAQVKAHAQPVCGVRYRGDGKLVASGGKDNAIHLLDVGSGKASGVLRGHGEFVYRLAFVEGGARLVSATAPTNEILVWDVAGASIAGRIARPLREVTAVAASPDGQWIFVGSSDGTAHAVSLADGSVKRFAGAAFGGTALAVSPDGSTLVTAEPKQIAVWDIASGEARTRIAGHGSFAQAAGFSRDGTTLVTAGMDGAIRTYQAASGEVLKTRKKGALEAFAMAISPDGEEIAYVSEDDAIVVTGLDARKPRISIETDDGADFLAFRGDGAAIAATSGGTVRAWDLATGEEIASFEVPIPAPSGDAADPHFPVAWSAGGDALLVGRRDGAVGVYGLDGELAATLHLAAEAAAGFALGPDGRVELLGGDAARALPIARVGGVVLPFADVEEKLNQRGLLAAALRAGRAS